MYKKKWCEYAKIRNLWQKGIVEIYTLCIYYKKYRIFHEESDSSWGKYVKLRINWNVEMVDESGDVSSR